MPPMSDTQLVFSVAALSNIDIAKVASTNIMKRTIADPFQQTSFTLIISNVLVPTTPLLILK